MFQMPSGLGFFETKSLADLSVKFMRANLMFGFSSLFRDFISSLGDRNTNNVGSTFSNLTSKADIPSGAHENDKSCCKHLASYQKIFLYNFMCEKPRQYP